MTYLVKFPANIRQMGSDSITIELPTHNGPLFTNEALEYISRATGEECDAILDQLTCLLDRKVLGCALKVYPRPDLEEKIPRS